MNTTDSQSHAQQLAMAEMDIRLALEAADLGYWNLNPNTGTFVCNERTKQLFGLPVHEEVNMALAINVIHDDDRERVVAAIERALHPDSGGYYEIEYRIATPPATVRAKGQAYFDANGTAYRFSGIVQDITAQKKSEEALTYQKRLLETVTANTSQALFLMDSRQHCIYMNEVAEQMTGFALAELEGKQLHYYVHHTHPDGRHYPLEECPIDQALPTQMRTKGEEVFVHKDGHFYPVAFTASPVVIDGVPVGTVIEVRDTTEEKQAQEVLRQNEERFRTLANSISQLAWMANADGWIHWYNDRWYEYTGTTLDEMQGWGWQQVHHPDHIDRVLTFVQDAWQRGEPWELTFPLRSRTGTFRWFLTRAYPVRDQQGAVVQWIGTNTDIDAQKQAEVLLEEKVRERTRRLEQKNKELEQFAHVSHHDLKEPIRKILIFTEMIRDDSYDRLTDASRNRLDRVAEAAQRMSVALKDTLEYASLSKDEPLEPVDLRATLDVVVADLDLAIAEKNADLHIAPLPTVMAVPAHMHQLFYNLLSNALKFTRIDTTPQITITGRPMTGDEQRSHPELDPSRPYHLLTVADNGIGFSAENAEKIFGMFQRLHNRKDYPGTGIGLALVRKVVANHGGKVWAESRPGEQTTFCVCLPAAA